jgi:hypothetical protein
MSAASVYRGCGRLALRSLQNIGMLDAASLQDNIDHPKIGEPVNCTQNPGISKRMPEGIKI